MRYSLFRLDGTPLFIYHTPLEIIANDYQLDEVLLNKIKEKKLIYEFDFEGTYSFSSMLKKQIIKALDEI